MTTFTLHDIDSAPEDSKPLLKESKEAFSMIPNLHAVMAESPQVLEGYQKLHELFTNTSFNADEMTVVWQTINVEHGCHYCVPAHTGIAKSMDVDDELIESLRNAETLKDEKLNALREFTLAAVRKRGDVSKDDVKQFFDAGYSEKQVLEVILGISQKTMSNYINAIAQTPVDEPFEKFAWEKK
jgi:alkylhydroperoxidase family enzyme